MVAGLGFLGYTYKEELSIPVLIERFTTKGGGSEISIPCVVNYESKVLRLKLNVSCRDKAQRSEIKRKTPRIQHALINTLRRPVVARRVMDRDLESVREHVSRVVSAQMSSPVKSVYLEWFFLD